MRTSLLTVVALAGALTSAPASLAASDQPAAEAIAHPTGAGRVVLRVSSAGGFVPVQVNLRALPSFTLYGDGTLFTPGAVTMIYPGPAIFPLVRAKLSERQIQAVLRRAKAAGLLAPHAIDYGNMGTVGISDAPTTTVILNAGGRHFQRSVYALGTTAHGGSMKPGQAKSRAALAGFVNKQLPRAVGAIWPPNAIAVYVGPYRGDAKAGTPRVVWPLASDLAKAGKPASNGLEYRCITVRDKDARTLLATLHKANEQSPWVAHGGDKPWYSLIARPLLPGERGCA